MGNSSSADKQNVAAPKSNFDPEYEVLNPKVALPHYGDIKLVRDVKTSQTMILKEVVVNTKQAFESELDFYNKRVTLGHPNVVNILGYTSVDKHNFCSTYFKISIFIEVLERNLHNELEARRVHGNKYTENELLQITDNLVSGLSYFQSQGFSHGDIRPVNVFANNNVYKLSDPSLNAQKDSNGLTAAIINGAHSLLSPQLIEQVPSNQFDIKCDPYRADVFSLGATLLSVATLTNSEELYDYSAGTINKQLIQERLENVHGSYSSFTHDLISSMLTVEESDRPDFVALARQLQPYENEIRTGGRLPFANVSSHVTSGETFKKSTLPGDESSAVTANTTLSQTDDLEARIRAALLRTQETFKAVAARDSAYNSNPTDYYSQTGNSYSTSSYVTPSERHEVKAHQGEKLKSSRVPDSAEVGASSTLQGASYVPESYLGNNQQTNLQNYGTTNYSAVSPSYDYGNINNVPTSYLTSNIATYGTTEVRPTNTYEGSYGVEGTLKSSAVHYEGERPLKSSAVNYGVTQVEQPLRSSAVNYETTQVERPLKSSAVNYETTQVAQIDTAPLRASYVDYNTPKSPLKSYLAPEAQPFYASGSGYQSGVYGTGSGAYGTGSGLAGSGVQTGYTGTYTSGNQAISGLENLAKSYHMDQNTANPATYTTSTYTTSYVTGGNNQNAYSTSNQGYTSNYSYGGSYETGVQGGNNTQLGQGGANTGFTTVEGGVQGGSQNHLNHSDVNAGTAVESNVQAHSHNNLDYNDVAAGTNHVEGNVYGQNNGSANHGGLAGGSALEDNVEGSASLKKSFTEARVVAETNEGQGEDHYQAQGSAGLRPTSNNEIAGN